MNKSPLDFSIFTYIWVFVLSFFGGLTYHIRKIKSGVINRFSLSEFIGDIIVSGFIGLLTFYFCEYSKFDPLLSAVLIGISSHQGTKLISFLEEYFYSKLEDKIKSKI